MSLIKDKALLFIFLIALVVRFLWFPNNTYFGFDEARDAFTSQQIYSQKDLVIVGPPANAPGLNHGVLHWYLVGALYSLTRGSIEFMSFFFRFANALAIPLVYWLAAKLWNRKTGLLAAILLAVSYEQTQYALYLGNPSLAIFSFIFLFGGLAIILKNKNKFSGLPLMALGIATGVQLELFLAILILSGMVGLVLVRKELKKITFKSYLFSAIIYLGLVSSYLAAEIKYNFKTIRGIYHVLSSNYNVLFANENKWFMWWRRLNLLVHDNLLPIDYSWIILILTVLILGLAIYFSIRQTEWQLTLLWMLTGLIITKFGGYNVYYINVGVGTGWILASAVLLAKLYEKKASVAISLLVISVVSSFIFIWHNNREGLNKDLKVQAGLTLEREIKTIDHLYQTAAGRGFTVLSTTMPYKTQTTWAYLLNRYGLSKYGYLPFWEQGNVLGYPGFIPPPSHGTTCLRFWLREPSGGIPGQLFDLDGKTENNFSKYVSETRFGDFVIETRQALAADCHNLKP